MSTVTYFVTELDKPPLIKLSCDGGWVDELNALLKLDIFSFFLWLIPCNVYGMCKQ